MAFLMAKITAPFVVLTALALLVHPCASAEFHRKLSSWSSGGATWYGGPTGAGSDGKILIYRQRTYTFAQIIQLASTKVYMSW
jgi:hypothetical protein